MLNIISRHDKYQPFQHPVDLQKFPDYTTIVQQPICLAEIKDKLTKQRYTYMEEFARDMMQIWINCKTYNEPASVNMIEKYAFAFIDFSLYFAGHLQSS